jgi:hypothetical protein
MSAVDDIERGQGRDLTPLEDEIDFTWPCCSVCSDYGWFDLGGVVTQCFCLHTHRPEELVSDG